MLLSKLRLRASPARWWPEAYLQQPYQCTTELHPISEVANLEKKVPLSWMNENHTQMTEDFLAYARPLIQAELTPLYIAGLPHHIYMKPQK